jgi:hypothetical protein
MSPGNPDTIHSRRAAHEHGYAWLQSSSTPFGRYYVFQERVDYTLLENAVIRAAGCRIA